MRVTLAQLNPIVGDIDGNLERVFQTVRDYADGSDLIAFPELFLVGYPPHDILIRQPFEADVQHAVRKLTEFSRDFPTAGILIGAPLPSEHNGPRRLHNAAILIYKGKIIGSAYKSLLPSYDVFDEPRYFDPAPEIKTVPYKDEVLGISICEDYWNEPELWPDGVYDLDPISILAEQGATLFVNISGSPYYVGKDEIRYRLIVNHVGKHHIPFVFVNQVGGNDELIFDGRSLCVDASGNIIEMLPAFEECVTTVDMKATGTRAGFSAQDDLTQIRSALKLGIRDYMRKTGFTRAVMGISGGIDSAVVFCLATEALGQDYVLGIAMPSQYSSEASVVDARQLADNLGVQLQIIPITSIYNAYLNGFQEHFHTGELDVSLENVQARIRGNILMAFSNKYGYLVLSTGNKSELATGYCTLYGDMAGGLAVISDLPKTMVYKLARDINREREIIPHNIIERPPSAELRPNQVDQDSLPPYDILDQILHFYIEEGYSLQDILRLDFDPEVVRWVIRTVDRNEYKRRQAPPGLKVTSKAFGTGRRMPIAAKY
ncbi:MAG: NAD+ synthase [Candidatus Zixiibacteriota bacterium]|nr:MAG: NAD+ synthase [candidate division Zixibacteria bacterium]